MAETLPGATGWARSGEADAQDEVSEPRLSTPPPAQCTMDASRMMASMTTTIQKKNTMMPGMAYPATVLALATASYPPPPNLFSPSTHDHEGFGAVFDANPS